MKKKLRAENFGSISKEKQKNKLKNAIFGDFEISNNDRGLGEENCITCAYGVK